MRLHRQINRDERRGAAMVALLVGLLAACGSSPGTVAAGGRDGGDRAGTATEVAGAVPSAGDALSACLEAADVRFVLVLGDGDSVGAKAVEGAPDDERRALVQALETCRPKPGESTLDLEEEARIAREHVRIIVECLQNRGIEATARWSEDRSSADLITPGLDQSSERYQAALDPCTAEGLAWEKGERKRLGDGG